MHEKRGVLERKRVEKPRVKKKKKKKSWDKETGESRRGKWQIMEKRRNSATND